MFLTPRFLALIVLALPAFAQQERITSFDSSIVLNTDASMNVRETIAVVAAVYDGEHLLRAQY